MNRLTKVLYNNKIYNCTLTYTDESYDSYLYTKKYNDPNIYKVFDFIANELENEYWKSISDISDMYKSYLSKNELYLYNIPKHYYCVSSLGRIAINKKTYMELISVICDDDGYLSSRLSYIAFPIKIHRLMGLLFLENDDPQNKTEINHISNPKCNNMITNLYWCHQIHNHNYIPLPDPNDSTDLPRIKKTNRIDYSQNTGEKLNNKIKCTNLHTNEVTVFNSSFEAANYYDIKHHQVISCCNKNQKYVVINNAYYLFEYYDNCSHIVNKAKDWEPIVQLNLDTTFAHLYITETELREANISSTSKIKKSCRDNRDGNECYHGTKEFIWMFLSHYNKYAKTKDFKYIDIESIVKPIVRLTKYLKFQQLYTNIYDIIKEDYNLTSVLNCCEKRDQVFNNPDLFVSSHNARSRNKWMYLEDFLRLKNINSLDNLTNEDMYNEILANEVRNSFKDKEEKFLETLKQ